MLADKTKLITVPEAARACGRNAETVRRWIWQGKLAARKLGNQLFIRPQDLENFLNRNWRPRFRLPAAPALSKGQIEEIFERSRKLQEGLFAKYGYFDVAAAVRESREEH